MPAWVAGGVAAAGLIGDLVSSQGQKSTNAQNMALQMQQEQWQEKMSDTAVQRRVADLKAAGVNPMLAAGQAASQPATGLATMQNPSASFTNAGQVAAGAAQTASNISLQNAQAAQAEAQGKLATANTPSGSFVTTSIGPDGSTEVTVTGQAGHGLGDAEMAQKAATVASLNATANNQNHQATLAEVNAQLTGLSVTEKAQLLDAFIKKQKAEYGFDTVQANTASKVYNTTIPKQTVGGFDYSMPQFRGPFGGIHGGSGNVGGVSIPETNVGMVIEAIRQSMGAYHGH